MVDTVILKATQSGNLSYFQQNVKFQDTKAAMLHYFHKNSGDTLTHIACRFGHTHILSLLSDEGFSLEAENFDGKTALHEAAQATNFECVEFLIHAGANVDAFKRADCTPLMLACTKDNVEVISLLLKNGANPSLINKDGWNSFHIAAREGRMSVIRELLQHNASLWDTVSKNGRTPLHTAVLHGHKEVVEFMLENCGYETDICDSCGTTPLMDALRVQNTEIARLLIDKHKELQAIVNDHFGSAESQPKPDETETQEQPRADDVDDEERDDPPDLRTDERVRDFLRQAEQGDEDDDEGPSDDESIPKEFPCSCSGACGEKFLRDEVMQQIYSLREMEKNEKELYIMGALNQLGVDKTTNGKRKWTKYQYRFKGSSVCRDFFKAAHDIKDFTLRALIKHMNTNGLVARVHGNTGKKPKHALKFDDVKRVFEFIVSYTEIHGMPQPAAPRGRDDIPPIFLHSSVTKKAVHNLYRQSCEDINVRVVSLRVVYDIWNQCCGHIQIASPRHDVCAKCEKSRKKISDSVSEEDIMQSTREMQDHVSLAQSERAVYQQCITEAKSEAEDKGLGQLIRPLPVMSTDYQSVHYTFDFAQNVCIPHHARQMGPLYFLTPRKVQVFGFRNDSVSQQLNYLIDEDQTIGQDGKQTHGPNAVISMVDNGLTRCSFGEPTFKLHADNCGGQNKNRYVMGYLAWRVMTGLNKEFTYMMQVPGHGRCLVDAGFAHLKRKYRTNDVDCLAQLATLVEKSSVSNEAVQFDDENGWVWRDWKGFISQHFLAVKGIRSYQHFRFHVDSPGVVFVKKTSVDHEVSVSILKHPAHRFDDARRPDVILPAGLSTTRKEYLYRSVRPYVRPQYQDITCPAPAAIEE